MSARVSPGLNVLLEALCRTAGGASLAGLDLPALLSLDVSRIHPAQRALIARCLGYGPPAQVSPALIGFLKDPEPAVVHEALASIRQCLPWAGLAPWGQVLNSDRSFDVALAKLLAQPRTHGELERVIEALATLEGARVEVRRALEGLNQRLAARFDAILARRDGDQTPGQITVIPSYRCNVRCQYCYMLERIDNPGAGMTYSQFAAIVRHAMSIGCTRVGFSGGEPTYHPDFARFLELLYENRLTTFFASNIIFPRKLVDSMDPRFLGSITAHLRPAADYTTGTWQLFLDNLAALRRRNVHVMLRYSVEPGNSVELKRLLDVTEQTGVRHVNLALAIPSPGGTNSFISATELRGHVRDFVSAARELEARGLHIGVSKPLPPCIVSAEDRRWMGELPYALGTCSIWKVGNTHNVVVNPDGSVWPCIVVDEDVGNFFGFESLADMGGAVQKVIDRRAGNHLFKECPDCPLFNLKRCQGACLAYKM